MGRLLYGPQEREIEFADRVLAHVQVVIVSKLRRSESFTLSWVGHGEDGRTTVWMHPAVPIQFQFDSTKSPQLNSAWLQDLNAAAARGDLRVSEEPSSS
jgi:hypothetical protein